VSSALSGLHNPNSTVLRKRDERVRRLVRRCRSLAPHLGNPAFGPVLQSFSRLSLLLSDSYEQLRSQDLIDDRGELRPSVETIRRLASTQAYLAMTLGLAPNNNVRELTRDG
jgi:hypothetical protein